MTEQDVIKRLKKAVAATGNQSTFAMRHGFSRSYVNDILHGRRALTERICQAVGIHRLIVYTAKSLKESK